MWWHRRLRFDWGRDDWRNDWRRRQSIRRHNHQQFRLEWRKRCYRYGNDNGKQQRCHDRDDSQDLSASCG